MSPQAMCLTALPAICCSSPLGDTDPRAAHGGQALEKGNMSAVGDGGIPSAHLSRDTKPK